MAAAKLEIHISELVDVIARRFRRLDICFDVIHISFVDQQDGQVGEADMNYVPLKQ